MSELATTVREALASLARADRGCRRFGAAHHRYQLAPPLSPDALDGLARTLGDELPADLRAFVGEVGSGGAGPAHGWLPIARAVDHVIAAPPGVRAWTRALPLAHLGCGYAAVLPLDGEARGSVWIDARVLDLVAPIDGSFTGFYLDWIDRLARGAWPEGHVPPGACALAAALSGYLGVCEQRRGLAAGSLAGEPLRAALAELGPGAIELAAEASPGLFEPGDRVDPCLVCARLLDTLAADGLGHDVVAPGVPPLPLRPPRADHAAASR